jgi:hypothetical protein
MRRLAPRLFEHFTQQRRQVAILGHDEARCSSAKRIGTEHTFSGLVRVNERDRDSTFAAAWSR